ncbi:hypothetical protein [Alicyclobacillus dauci]|uniref:Uncharacterized protein n=1 Tax=Alicyclobacillus dauci TaxID=1475485 RepID=A0ABY6Z3C9_9BACL|nr:hypothetical protein [Alicyclobacillus dauci]WAH36831.1 hypothetical protein NZD86_22120 [Alicyclobacillus dauci]
MAIDKYRNLPSEHQGRPKSTAGLSAALNKIDDGMTATKSIPSAFDVDNAAGV